MSGGCCALLAALQLKLLCVCQPFPNHLKSRAVQSPNWLVGLLFFFQNWRLARDTVLKTRMRQNVLSCGKLLNDSFILQKFQNIWCNFRKKPVVVCSFNANGFCSVQRILRIIIILQSCDTIIKARRVKTNNLLHLADFAGAYYSMSKPFNSTKKCCEKYP